MRKFEYIVLSLSALLMSASAAYSQDLDPTVVVDRAYEGKLIEVHKPALEMSVPDTVMRFDLDFDYSVFERPYKGSYEFQPYLLSMKPSAVSEAGRRFFLKAGVGYQLHPTLDLVWSPLARSEKKAFSVDVYAGHRSYVGNYASCGGNDAWSGYDMKSEAGVGMNYDWMKGALELDVAYCGFHQKEPAWRRGYNALDLDFNINSKNSGVSGFIYDLGVAYRLAGDRTHMADSQVNSLTEHNISADLMLGFKYKERSRIVLETAVRTYGYSGFLQGNAVDVVAVPKFIYRRGILSADLGLKVSYLVLDELSGVFRYPSKGQLLSPDVSVRLTIVPGALAFYADAGGGNKVDSYSSLLEWNHHVNLTDSNAAAGPGEAMGVTVERFRAAAGFDGRIGSSFSYNVFGGYSDYASGLLNAVAPVSENGVDRYVSGVGYAPYSAVYAGVDILFRNERVTVDGSFVYSDYKGSAFAADSYCLKPSAFKGDIAVEYNYNRRIFAGVDCRFASASTLADSSYEMPAYADLGIELQYVTSRRLSFWLRGGNLLGMTIQRNPLYAEKGVYFTAGICLNL